MKKILSFFAISAMISTTSTSVVACSNISDVKVKTETLKEINNYFLKNNYFKNDLQNKSTQIVSNDILHWNFFHYSVDQKTVNVNFIIILKNGNKFKSNNSSFNTLQIDGGFTYTSKDDSDIIWNLSPSINYNLNNYNHDADDSNLLIGDSKDFTLFLNSQKYNQLITKYNLSNVNAFLTKNRLNNSKIKLNNAQWLQAMTNKELNFKYAAYAPNVYILIHFILNSTTHKYDITYTNLQNYRYDDFVNKTDTNSMQLFAYTDYENQSQMFLNKDIIQKLNDLYLAMPYTRYDQKDLNHKNWTIGFIESYLEQNHLWYSSTKSDDHVIAECLYNFIENRPAIIKEFLNTRQEDGYRGILLSFGKLNTMTNYVINGSN